MDEYLPHVHNQNTHNHTKERNYKMQNYRILSHGDNPKMYALHECYYHENTGIIYACVTNPIAGYYGLVDDLIQDFKMMQYGAYTSGDKIVAYESITTGSTGGIKKKTLLNKIGCKIKKGISAV